MEKTQKIIAMFLLITLAMISVSISTIGITSANQLGTNLDVRVDSEVEARSSEEKKISINGEDIKTSLRIETGVQNRVLLSNGLYAEIRVMPDIATETAIARVRLNACSEENNCTVELREVRVNNEARASYEVRAEKEYRVFGLIRAKANVETNVDAETGAIINTNVPWWTRISTEVKGNSASQVNINR